MPFGWSGERTNFLAFLFEGGAFGANKRNDIWSINRATLQIPRGSVHVRNHEGCHNSCQTYNAQSNQVEL